MKAPVIKTSLLTLDSTSHFINFRETKKWNCRWCEKGVGNLLKPKRDYSSILFCISSFKIMLLLKEALRQKFKVANISVTQTR
jgi:hypothetical protein